MRAFGRRARVHKQLAQGFVEQNRRSAQRDTGDGDERQRYPHAFFYALIVVNAVVLPDCGKRSSAYAVHSRVYIALYLRSKRAPVYHFAAEVVHGGLQQYVRDVEQRALYTRRHAQSQYILQRLPVYAQSFKRQTNKALVFQKRDYYHRGGNSLTYHSGYRNAGNAHLKNYD